MKQCYFCGANEEQLEIRRVRFEGKENGKRRQKTINICACCDAMSDDKWCIEKFGWDCYTWAGYVG